MKRGKKKPASAGKNVVHPNVSRVDYEANHGYSVRIQRKGKETSKLFSDSVYGGKAKAKAAAIAWRDKKVKRLGGAIPPGSHGVPAKPPGYSYIKRMRVPFIIRGVKRMVLCWVGFLRIEDRKHLSTRWSIDKWGSTEAKAGAEAWLAEKKGELKARLGRTRRAKKSVETPQPIPLPEPAKPVKLPEPAKLPEPKSRAKQLAFQECGSCGGVVRLMKGPGRMYSYRDRLVRIPEDFPTETCVGCGKVSMNEREALELEKRIVVKIPSKKRRRA